MNTLTQAVRRSCRAGLLALLALAPLGAAPLAGLSLREALTPEEFARSGLAKLTAEELAYLSVHVQPVAPRAADHPSPAPAPAVAAAPRGDAAFGQEEKLQARVAEAQKIPAKIESRLAGRFSGWDGRTLFKLENGQTWRQAEPAVFVADLDRPAVTIQKGLFGTYYLRVAGYGSQVKVLRVD